jgi:hypothetical protein
MATLHKPVAALVTVFAQAYTAWCGPFSSHACAAPASEAALTHSLSSHKLAAVLSSYPTYLGQ